MHRFRLLLMSGLGLALYASRGASQSAVPIRELASPSAVSTRPFGLILNVRSLANGKVLVNDGGSRQLVVLDSALSNAVVLLDSVVGATGGYGPRASPLINYLGDSTLFVDGQSLSLLLITPLGEAHRVVSAPKPRVIGDLAGNASGVDRNGSLIYRGPIFLSEKSLGPGLPMVLSVGDSVPLVRANFETRSVDTIARLKLPSAGRTEMLRAADGSMQTKLIVNPIYSVDEWAVLTGGSIALVRGRDYHIDWIRPDGTRMSTPKLPFDWKRLSDADKIAIVDSTRTAIEKQTADAAEKRKTSLSESGRRPPPETTTITFVPLSEMDDYQPAIRFGAVKPDLDDNIWILPSTSAQSRNGELVYDVVNSAGVLKERVRVPVGHSIAGFGNNGVVFLISKEANQWVLKRSRVM